MQYGWHRSEDKHGGARPPALAPVAPETLFVWLTGHSCSTTHPFVASLQTLGEEDPIFLKFRFRESYVSESKEGGEGRRGDPSAHTERWTTSPPPCQVIDGASFHPTITHVGGQIKPLHGQNCLHGGGGSGGPGSLHDSVFTAALFPLFPGMDVDLHGCGGLNRDASTCDPSSPVN